MAPSAPTGRKSKSAAVSVSTYGSLGLPPLPLFVEVLFLHVLADPSWSLEI